MKAKFVGRAPELRQLGTWLDRDGPSIAVIYGRRRIGKSSLIERALRGRPALLFEGLENQPKRQQIEAFLFQLARQARTQDRRLSAGDWRAALILLEPVLKKRSAAKPSY